MRSVRALARWPSKHADFMMHAMAGSNTHTASLVKLTLVALGLLAGVGVTYAAPALTAYRPWTPGEDVPLLRAWSSDAALVPGFAEAQRAYGASDEEDSLVSSLLGTTGSGSPTSSWSNNTSTEAQRSSNQGASVGRSSRTGKGPRSGAEREADLGAGRTATGELASNQASDTPREGLRAIVSADEYGQVAVPIVDPGFRGLAPFFEQLIAVAQKKSGSIARVSHYGDSSIATDSITSTARTLLQQKFGDAGHGFVLVSKGYMPYRHEGLSHKASSTWMMRFVVKGDDRDGLFGYGGAAHRARFRSWASFGSASEGPVGQEISRFEVWFQREEKGGAFSVRVDEGTPQEVSTSWLGDTPPLGARDGVHVVKVPRGRHTFRVEHARGKVTLYGVVLENDGPGVVYDSLGLVGARAKRMLNFNRDHLRAQLAQRNTHLVVFGFGGNEAGDALSSVDRYRETYESVLAHVLPSRTRAIASAPSGKQEAGTRSTAGPSAGEAAGSLASSNARLSRQSVGCLMFAPLDQAERDEVTGNIRSMATLKTIVEAQRQAAKAKGCAFYNAYEAMGGEGSMKRWYRARLAMSDFRHATPKGYELMGTLFYRALLKAFDDYLAERER